MSYILEALKRSEQERTRGVAPTLHAVHAEPSPESKRAFRYYPPMLAILVVATMIGWLRPWQAETGTAAVRVAPFGAAEKARPAHRGQAAAPAERPAAPVPQDAPHSGEKRGEEGQRPTRAPAARRAASAVSPIAASPRSVPAETTAGPIPEDVIDFSELPVAIRRSLPKLDISGYVNYPGDPSGRMMAIGDRLVREGEEIGSGLKLEQIAASGAIFSYKGYRFRAPVP
jgi:general secretion pathway protein B